MAAIRKEDVQDIVGEIREMLELRNDPSEAALQRLAQKYVSVIQQVNGMLKTCLDLFRGKGRRRYGHRRRRRYCRGCYAQRTVLKDKDLTSMSQLFLKEANLLS